jgi:hypothetical protein
VGDEEDEEEEEEDEGVEDEAGVSNNPLGKRLDRAMAGFAV